MTISSAINVLMKFVISITFSFAFFSSKYDDIHPVWDVRPWSGLGQWLASTEQLVGLHPIPVE